MPRRAATTILLITRQELVRADVNGSKVTAHWRQPRPDLPDFASLIEAALLPGGQPGRKVWVLSSDFWTQTLSLPSGKVTGLVGSQLSQALNYEAEGLSGVSAFEAIVGQVELPPSAGARHFWLVQVKADDLNQIEEAVRGAGGHLQGVGHPGGVPRTLSETTQTSSRRLELWPDAVVGIHRNGTDTRLRVFNIDPGMGRWMIEAAAWEGEIGPAEHRETLAASGIFVGEGSSRDDLLLLQDDDVLQRWLSAWAGELPSRPERLPVVRPAVRPMSSAKHLAIMAAITLFAVLLCGGHWLYLELQRASIQMATGSVLDRVKPYEEGLKLVETKTIERDKLLAENKHWQLAVEQVERQRERYAKLLGLLAEFKSDDLLIQKIEGEGGTPKLIGIAMQPEIADELASKLATALRGMGWEVQPPKKQAKNLVPGGGPWSFEIAVKETVEIRLPPKPKGRQANGPRYQVIDREASA